MSILTDTAVNGQHIDEVTLDPFGWLDGAMEPGDTFLGELPDEARKHFEEFFVMQDKIEQLEVELESITYSICEHNHTCGQKHVRSLEIEELLRVLRLKAETLQQLVRNLIDLEFGTFGNDGVIICDAGTKVVMRPATEKPEPRTIGHLLILTENVYTLEDDGIRSFAERVANLINVSPDDIEHFIKKTMNDDVPGHPAQRQPQQYHPQQRCRCKPRRQNIREILNGFNVYIFGGMADPQHVDTFISEASAKNARHSTIPHAHNPRKGGNHNGASRKKNPHRRRRQRHNG